MTTLKIGTVWACNGFVYYGVVLLITRLYAKSSMITTHASSQANAVCEFDYSSIAINTSAEFVGILCALITIDWLGRRFTQVWGYSMSAIALVIMGLLHDESSSTILILGYIIRAVTMVASQTGWVMTPELYPTHVRATAHSLVNCFARIGALLSPYLVISSLSPLNVALILGIVNMVAVIASYSLKETAGKAMDKPISYTDASNDGDYAVVSDHDRLLKS